MNVDNLIPLTRDRVDASMSRTLQELQPNSELLKLLREALARMKQNITFITCVEQMQTLVPVSRQMVIRKRCAANMFLFF
jgi:hypothetical protein